MVKIAKKRVAKIDRHVRWNWERSPDDREKVRYHFVVVDNKRREGTVEKVLAQFQKFGSVELGILREGKVDGSPHRYLLQSFDSPIALREIDLTLLGLPVIKDENLYERKIGSLENYVADFYSKK